MVYWLPRTSAVLCFLIVFCTTLWPEVSSGQEYAATVPVPKTDDRIPVRFVHVDVTDGAAGQRLASNVRSLVGDSRTLRADDASTMVVWLRTLTVPTPGAPTFASEHPSGSVAYSVIIDLGGKHITDMLGFTTADRSMESATGIVESVHEMALRLVTSGDLVSF